MSKPSAIIARNGTSIASAHCLNTDAYSTDRVGDDTPEDTEP
jgi:hypothetical protein